MGTPEFGATILSELVKQHNVVLVVTQPDKLVGRKREIEFSAVKKKAIELNIPVFQPINIRKEYQYIIDNYDFDLIVTAAYGQIVGTKLLYHPKYRSINVHGSLLPKHRGGAPIQRSIINGDKETGITIMYMEKGMDSGDMLAQESIKIEQTDNSDSLFIKLADLGAKMINQTIEKLVNNEIIPIKQNEEEVTYSPKEIQIAGPITILLINMQQSFFLLQIHFIKLKTLDSSRIKLAIFRTDPLAANSICSWNI